MKRQPQLPRVQDLPTRYTVEPYITFRIWDHLKNEYADSMDFDDQQTAEYVALRMEDARHGRPETPFEWDLTEAPFVTECEFAK